VLDDVKRGLLNFIVMQAMQGSRYWSELLFFKQICISYTLNRRIFKLARAGFICYGSDIDGRKKYLELTIKSQDYFAKLGQCITSASLQTKFDQGIF
jgi:hypothetical protein